MSNPKLTEYSKATQFKPGQSGNPKGKTPSRLKQFIKEYNVPKNDVDTLLKNLIWSYSHNELRDKYEKLKTGDEKDDLPAGVAAFISGILHDVRRGDMKVLTQILDRIYGKPVQSIEADVTTLSAADMTPEERKILIAAFMEKANV